MFGEIAEALMDIAFSIFGFDIDIGNLGLTAKGLCDWTKISSSEFGTIAETLNGAFVSVGLQLLTVFVMIDLIKKAMEIDRISWERIVMSVARFLIFKMLITYSYEFLNMIMKIGQQFMNILLRTVNYQTSAGTSIGATIGDMINNAEGLELIINFTPAIMFMVFIVIYLPLIGTFVMCIAQIFSRVVKIVLAFAFAPIPIAIGTWEDGSGTGKRFIMNAVALAFEGLVMILCVHIYALGLSDMQSGLMVQGNNWGECLGCMIGILLMNGILTTALTTSSQLAEKWSGA